MRALLSAVGTRGDVQPILAVAVQLRALGHDVRLCVPPNFVDWARGFGFEAVPVGVEMRAPPPRPPGAPPVPPPPMPDLITDQFERVGAAMEGCDVVLGGNAHQYAARSLAELRRVPYVTALYAPVAIPSGDHPPPPAPGQKWTPADPATNAKQWADNLRAWNSRALERVNENRARLGLGPIDDVLRFNLTSRPWLATDEVLAPVPRAPELEIFETGAWILEDRTPLPGDVEDFLAAGPPPLYLGFGSMPAPPEVSRTLIGAARKAGRRAILSKGWADLSLLDGADDCLAVGDVNLQALLPRAAAAVHHGGAGPTATAARAGVPQVISPMFSDQFYWGTRVHDLGIGTKVEGPLTTESLAAALAQALEPEIAARARAVAASLPSDGAGVAARRLLVLPEGRP